MSSLGVNCWFIFGGWGGLNQSLPECERRNGTLQSFMKLYEPGIQMSSTWALDYVD